MDTSNNPTNAWEYDQYIKLFDALSHPIRVKIIGLLEPGQQYVSELARQLNISRPLLYMHLRKLELAGLVTSHLEISNLGKATKFYQLVPLEMNITTALLAKLSTSISITSNNK